MNVTKMSVDTFSINSADPWAVGLSVTGMLIITSMTTRPVTQNTLFQI